jgi:hypothetical protein
VTKAITAAFDIISAEVEATIVEDDNELLDSAALILARKILERGRISIKQKTQDTPADYVDNVIPKEARLLIERYKTEASGTSVWHKNEQPSTHSSSITFWRSSV